MTNILNRAKTTAETYGLSKDYLASANIAAFENTAKAMIAQGICLEFIFQSSIHSDWGFFMLVSKKLTI